MSTTYQQVADFAAASGADEAEREKRQTDRRIHYGPIYGRPVGETMALCKPAGSTATMSNAWHMVDCPACLGQRLNRTIL